VIKITKPTLLLNETIARANIQRMADKAEKSGVKLRPHFKTHQSADVAQWIREAGTTAATVSSVDMGLYFAEHGWDDIVIAFLVNWLEIDDINRLAEICHLGLLVDSLETVNFLNDNLKHPVDIWLDVDAGLHRTGFAWDNYDHAKKLSQAIMASDKMTLTGMLTHTGNSYVSRTDTEIRAVYDDTVARFQSLRDFLEAEGFGLLELSVGDTPCCSVVEDFSAVDEIRPGCYVFFEMLQAVIGVCTVDDVAVGVACPVVAIQRESNEIVLHGGAVHISNYSVVDRKGQTMFGRVAKLTDDGWKPLPDTTYVKRLSQEHGMIHADADALESIQIGDVLVVLPVHVCTAANLLKRYHLFDGRVFEMATIPRY
jgi:D-serine deaminase-like pyridoxal phosphate-dependent protein